MSYAEAIEHLNALGQELAPSSSTPRRKFELEHMRILAHALGDPQRSFPAILIAGTNGKGSTAATLASICAHSGLRTGLYTSPHLTHVTERIRTNCGRRSLTTDHLPLPTAFTDIPEADFAALYFYIDDAARQLVATEALPHPPSFFETLTALAFLYFRECKLDIAILEVGLGGRLDATNIVEPVLSIITDIALDHQEYLGSTLADIAREKAGILRPNGTLITLPQHPEANQAIGEAAVALNVRAINAADYLPGRTAPPIRTAFPVTPQEAASLHAPVSPEGAAGFSPLKQSPHDKGALAPGLSPTTQTPRSNHYTLNLDNQPLQINSPLPGEHQQRNIALAIAAALELRNQQNYTIPNSAIEAGIANTHWPGRLELLPPNLLLDVAHNPAGAWTLRSAIAALPESQPRTLIFSCLRDKDLTEMAQILFPLFDSSNDRPHDHIILAPIDNPRAASLDQLLAAAQRLDIPAHPTQTPAEALALARSLTPAEGLIIATGSVYLVGTLRDLALNPTPTVHPQ